MQTNQLEYDKQTSEIIALNEIIRAQSNIIYESDIIITELVSMLRTETLYMSPI
jgi:hypothetical protein